jgi:hypothetical protein
MNPVQGIVVQLTENPVLMHDDKVNSSRRQVLVALSAALAGGLLVWFYYALYAPQVWSDFDQVWLGSRALLAGQDPYVEVPKAFPWPLYYPLPALLIGLPFAPWPLLTSRILWGALTAGVGTWAILRYRPHAWPLLLSAPFAYSLVRGQWAPLLVAGALIPWLGGVIAAKPSTGLAVFAYRPTVRAVAGAATLGLVSLAVRPSWPAEWLAAIKFAPHLIVPALMPGGLILLVAFARWRRPDARLLAVLSCVPQTPGLYETFFMALVPATRRQAAAVGLSWNVFYLVTLATHESSPLTLAQALQHGVNGYFWPFLFFFGYMPALGCVLWPSPLRERPKSYPRWPPWRQSAYRVAWGTTLGLVGFSVLLWAYLLWSRAWLPCCR